ENRWSHSVFETSSWSMNSAHTAALNMPSSRRRSGRSATETRRWPGGRTNPCATSRSPSVTPGSGLVDDDRAGDEVVPASAAAVHEDPDDAEVEDQEADPQPDQADDRGAAVDPTPVGVAHDAQPEEPHPRGLAAAGPEEREVAHRHEQHHEHVQE